MELAETATYRGRIAPSPTGLLHVGHARTFWVAQQRALAAGGELLLRNDDLDPQRARAEFVQAMVEDLLWLGIRWAGAPQVQVVQSQRTSLYVAAWQDLLSHGHIYPCKCSRRELAALPAAPHEGDDAEPVYPGTCRRTLTDAEISDWYGRGPAGANWRFRVPHAAEIRFADNNAEFGERSYVAGLDFGDFAIWRRDGVPAYQLACVVDDAAMGITEVVRGADLLLSTARQMLLQGALGLPTPQHYHCPLMTDENGQRLAKRADAKSLRTLRQQGLAPQQVIASF